MNQYYESAAIVQQYLLFHYGTAEEILPYPSGPHEALHFPLRCVEQGIDLSILPDNARALDLGCAVGRSSFELSKHCDSVTAIDQSTSFINVAKAIQESGGLPYEYPLEGELTANTEACPPKGSRPARIQFLVGDAMHIDTEGVFDVVLLANLLCRLPDPVACLKQLNSLLSEQGQIFITTPCTWMEEYTEQSNWLGGREAQRNTFETIQSVLEPEFTCTWREDMPFLIREHVRKFQWSVAEASRWVRTKE